MPRGSPNLCGKGVRIGRKPMGSTAWAALERSRSHSTNSGLSQHRNGGHPPATNPFLRDLSAADFGQSPS